MKILQVTPSYKPAYIYGGPTVSVSLLSEQLQKNGTAIQVFTTTANGNTELDIKPGVMQSVEGVSVIYFKRITKDHTHFSPQLLARLWKDCRSYDVVHIHGWWNTVSMLAAWVAVLCGVPVIVSPRGMLSRYTFGNKNSGKKGLLHRFLGKRLLEQAFVHTTTKNESDAVAAIVKAKGLFEIPNFVTFSNQPVQYKTGNNTGLQMLFFSRIEEKKGLDILFDVLPHVQQSYHLTIAGDGEPAYVKALKSMAAQNGISDKISWVGFKTKDKFAYLSGFDLMVLPSHDENFGNVVVESLSVGTPVLVSENVGLSAYVQHNQLGWVCPLSSEALAATINQVLQQQDKLSAIRSIAPGKIATDFNSAEVLNRYLQMYKFVTGND